MTDQFHVCDGCRVQYGRVAASDYVVRQETSQPFATRLLLLDACKAARVRSAA